MRRVAGIVFLFVCAVGWPQSFSFHTGVTYPAQLGPLATVSADFNGDGKLDLAVANAAASSVTIFLGKGDGTFSDGATVAIPGECIDDNITAGDFNNDGKIDLLTVCGFQTTVWVLPGLGTGQFGTPIATNLPATAVYGFFDVFNYQEVAVADFNGDGNLDLVVGLLGETGKNEAIKLPISWRAAGISVARD